MAPCVPQLLLDNMGMALEHMHGCLRRLSTKALLEVCFPLLSRSARVAVAWPPFPAQSVDVVWEWGLGILVPVSMGAVW
jgi:hypothetical protein